MGIHYIVRGMALFALLGPFAGLHADDIPDVRGTLRFASTAVRFDVSPPLRDVAVIPPPQRQGDPGFFGALMADPDPEGPWTYGPQQADAAVQAWTGPPMLIPSPLQSFPVGTGTANPPDPAGDVGPNHYVRMSNASFQIFTKTGTSVFGPANINTLFVGFGGDCEFENAGDPIVLYDQLADRWLLTQFSNSTGPGFFNCVALSTTADPTGTYFRWAFPAAVFPDYPKYGIWPNAYLFSTRELGASPSQIGVYAVDRTQMLAGNPTPTVISFVNPLSAGVAQFVGDGLLPADVDGSTPPPVGSPAYFVGSMDDGGPYGATRDALSLWRFNINFAAPANSSFVLAATIPIASYDTIFPCNGRSCVTQPAPLGAVDILSYRQRPMNRAAYRNFGSYEAIYTNQSVEAGPAMAGIRWWEVRNPGGVPMLYQDSTFAPGLTDNVNRWMGSIAADRSGNLALGYSASGASVFPSIRYTGRLEGDPLNEMAQGEGEFIAAGGGSTQATRRWGDYTSMNIDPVDDCTFWYINEYFAVSGTTWTLRAGSFKFPDCGTPSFGLGVTPIRQLLCTTSNAVFNVEAHAYSGFTGAVGLTASGVPAGATAAFSNPTIGAVPGTSTFTLSNLGAIASGSYAVSVNGLGGTPAASRSRVVNLDLISGTPTAPTLSSPPSGAASVGLLPALAWSSSNPGQTHVVEIATDAAFNNIVFTSAALTVTSLQLTAALNPGSTYFWRVRSSNTCGPGAYSAVFTFSTRLAAGLCAAGDSIATTFSDTMENGTNGWTVSPAAGNTWTQSTARPFSPATAWLAADVPATSDQRLTSPPITLPANQSLLLLRFQHDVTMQPGAANACIDGGLVEISTNGGTTFTALPPNSVVEDFLDGALPTGERAWCGTQPYTTASIDVDAFAGQTVRFRFRALTDSSVGSVPHGWYVDDVRVVGCLVGTFRDGFEAP